MFMTKEVKSLEREVGQTRWFTSSVQRFFFFLKLGATDLKTYTNEAMLKSQAKENQQPNRHQTPNKSDISIGFRFLI